MTRRTTRRAHPQQAPNSAQARALHNYARRLGELQGSRMIAERRHRNAWYKTAPRLPIAMVQMTPGRIADLFGVPRPLLEPVGATEHWADTLLHCPRSLLNRHTARFAGKPYHWRQDYTGQLKLAAGESPW